VGERGERETTGGADTVLEHVFPKHVAEKGRQGVTVTVTKRFITVVQGKSVEGLMGKAFPRVSVLYFPRRTGSAGHGAREGERKRERQKDLEIINGMHTRNPRTGSHSPLFTSRPAPIPCHDFGGRPPVNQSAAPRGCSWSLRTFHKICMRVLFVCTRVFCVFPHISCAFLRGVLACVRVCVHAFMRQCVRLWTCSDCIFALFSTTLVCSSPRRMLSRVQTFSRAHKLFLALTRAHTRPFSPPFPLSMLPLSTREV